MTPSIDDLFDTVTRKIADATGRAPKGDGTTVSMCCPAHEDRSPSLTVSIGQQRDRVVMHCHTGCTAEAVAGAIGLELRDLFVPDDTRPPTSPVTVLPSRPSPPAVYEYHDADGTLVGRVHRKADKRFVQQRADGTWKGFGRHLYRLPHVLKAIGEGRGIVVVEGEKDADRLAADGIAATTSIGGAGKWTDDLARHLAGAHVVIIPDNDPQGRDHARQVATSLHGTAATVKVLDLPGLPDHGDVSDWLDAGHTVEDLRARAGATPYFDPDVPDVTTSWAAIDASDLLDGTYERPQPTQGLRDDGVGLFYPGYTNALHGESESGKSWLGMWTAAQALQRGETVAYLDFEQDAADVYGRMRLLGATVDQLRHRFRYVQPQAALDDHGRHDLAAAIDSAALVIIDGVTDAMGIHGLSPNDNAEYAEFDHLLPRWCARGGAAVVTVDHVTKTRDGDTKYAIGAQHKRASVQGAAYRVEVVDQPAPGAVGLLRLHIAKDRHGAVRERDPKRAGEFEIDSTGDTITCALRAPTPAEDRGQFRPTHYMEQISKLLEETDGALSGNAIEKAVGGKAQYVRQALRELVDTGHIKREAGSRNAILHRLVTPFRELDELPTSSRDLVSSSDLVPSSSPGQGRSPVSTSSRSSDPPYVVGGRDEVEDRGARPSFNPCAACGSTTNVEPEPDGTPKCPRHRTQGWPTDGKAGAA